MYFSGVTWVNEKSGEINSDAFIGNVLAKVILIFYSATSMADTGVCNCKKYTGKECIPKDFLKINYLDFLNHIENLAYLYKWYLHCLVQLSGAQPCPTLCDPTDYSPPDTIAPQAPLSMEFSRQEYWSGLPFPPPEDLCNPGIKPVSLVSPALAGGVVTTAPLGIPRKDLEILKWQICNEYTNIKGIRSQRITMLR